MQSYRKNCTSKTKLPNKTKKLDDLIMDKKRRYDPNPNLGGFFRSSVHSVMRSKITAPCLKLVRIMLET